MKGLSVTFFLIFIFSIFLYGQQANPIKAELKKPDKVLGGFIDPNFYYDTRKSYDFTLNFLAILPHRFQYFTFSNYSGSLKNNVDLSSYYSEHHVYWGITEKSPFDLSLQWMNVSGDKNDALRLGFRYRFANTPKFGQFFKRIGFTYNVAFHVFQFDAQSDRSPWLTQIEHFYRLTLFKNRIYISGFADQDIFYKQKKLFAFVTEHQIGLRIVGGLHLVAEYRFNDYRTEKKGWGLGLEYFMSF